MGLHSPAALYAGVPRLSVKSLQHRLPIPSLNPPRQTGMGVSNVWARVGSMIAPLVKITGELQPFIPNVIFGTMTLLGGCAAFFLLETLNRPLPETIEDIQDW